ncbi:hypothetical protein MBLNU230_g5098t1 [Neophaeotheca triangularis]
MSRFPPPPGQGAYPEDVSASSGGYAPYNPADYAGQPASHYPPLNDARGSVRESGYVPYESDRSVEPRSRHHGSHGQMAPYDRAKARSGYDDYGPPRRSDHRSSHRHRDDYDDYDDYDVRRSSRGTREVSRRYEDDDRRHVERERRHRDGRSVERYEEPKKGNRFEQAMEKHGDKIATAAGGAAGAFLGRKAQGGKLGTIGGALAGAAGGNQAEKQYEKHKKEKDGYAYEEDSDDGRRRRSRRHSHSPVGGRRERRYEESAAGGSSYGGGRSRRARSHGASRRRSLSSDSYDSYDSRDDYRRRPRY